MERERESLKNTCSRMQRKFPLSSINLSFTAYSLWCTIISDKILTSGHALSAVFLDDVTTSMRARQRDRQQQAVKQSYTYSVKESQAFVS